MPRRRRYQLLGLLLVAIALGSAWLWPNRLPDEANRELPIRHAVLSFSQSVDLVCEEREIVDNGGFDTFTMDIWIDNRSDVTRFDVRYPDGTEYSMLLDGTGPEWDGAWGRGADGGRNIGCLERRADGSELQSIAGWAWFDSSPLFFDQFLAPAQIDGGVLITPAFDEIGAVDDDGDGVYVGEAVLGDGVVTRRIESELDGSGRWLVSQRHTSQVIGLFSETGLWEVRVAESRSFAPPGTFDPDGFTRLWTR